MNTFRIGQPLVSRRRIWLFVSSLWVMGSIVLGGMGAGPAVVRATSPGCSKIIPVDALGGSLFGSGASGAFAVASIDTPLTVLAGGAAPVAATAGLGVAGTVGLGVAAFVGSFYGTCKFLDWAVGDGATVDAVPAQSALNATLGPRVACNTVAPDEWPVRAADECRTITRPVGGQPSEMLADNTYQALTFGGSVTMPVPTYAPGQFGPQPSSWPDVPIRFLGAGGHIWCEMGHYGVDARCDTTQRGTVEVLRFPGCDDWGPGGLGGYCGVHPNTVVVGGTNGNGFSLVISPMPEARDLGWKRHVLTDVNCAGSGWVRAISPEYSDRQVSSRIPTPSCPAGQLTVGLRVWRVPINVNGGTDCAVGASLCFSAASKVFDWAAPASWTASDAPSWVTCLSTDCGVPVMNSTVCNWSTFAVPTSFCDAGRQAGVVPGTSAVATGTLTANAYVPGAIPVTVEPVVVPPTTVPAAGVVVPIDPGRGALCVASTTTVAGSTSVAASTSTTVVAGSTTTADPGASTTVPVYVASTPVPTTTQLETTTTALASTAGTNPGGSACSTSTGDGGDSPCAPSGWGWFNPVEWVQKPVKCAILWAFVPKNFQGWVDRQTAQMKSVAPFSFIAEILSFADVATTPVPGATGCMPGLTLPKAPTTDADPYNGSTVITPCLSSMYDGHQLGGQTVLRTIIFFSMIGLTVLAFASNTVGMIL